MDLLHSFFFYKDGRFKTISSQMRSVRTMKATFLFLSYLIYSLARTAEGTSESVAAQAAGALLALGIVFEANPLHAGFCISASIAFLILLHLKGFHRVLSLYTILLTILLGLWTFCQRTERRMPKVVEMYFGLLEWVLTLVAIACGLEIAMSSKQGLLRTFFPFAVN